MEEFWKFSLYLICFYIYYCGSSMRSSFTMAARDESSNKRVCSRSISSRTLKSTSQIRESPSFIDVFQSGGLLATLCDFLDTEQDVVLGLGQTCCGLFSLLSTIPLSFDQHRGQKYPISSLSRAERLPCRIRAIKLEVDTERPQDLSDQLTLAAAVTELERLGSADTIESLTILQPLNSSALDIQSLGRLKSLRSLSITWASGLKSLECLAASDDVGNFKKLEDLSLVGCNELVDLSGLGECSSLKSLKLGGCANLKDLGALALCSELQSIHLGGCRKVSSLEFLKPLRCLRSVVVDGSLELRSADDLLDPACFAAASLRSVTLSWCPKLESVVGLAALPHLQNLSLCGSSAVGSITALNTCLELQELDLGNCHMVMDLACLEASLNLRRLCLGGRSVKHKMLASQAEQYAASGLRLGSIVEKLEHLQLSGIEWITDLKDLGSCSALKSLEIEGASKLDNIEALTDMPELERISLRYCSSLQRVNSLEGCVKLSQVDLMRCSKLEDLPEALVSNSSIQLNVTGCAAIRTGSSCQSAAKMKTIKSAQPSLAQQRLRSVGRRGKSSSPKFSQLALDLPRITIETNL